jgi:hypothetical protein
MPAVATSAFNDRQCSERAMPQEATATTGAISIIVNNPYPNNRALLFTRQMIVTTNSTT